MSGSTTRQEDRRLVIGQGHYAADWNLPGQLHAAFARADRALAASGSELRFEGGLFRVRGEAERSIALDRIIASAAGTQPHPLDVRMAAKLGGNNRTAVTSPRWRSIRRPGRRA